MLALALPTNADVVREMFDAYLRGDFETSLEQFADDVEWETVFGERFRGREGVAESVRKFSGTWLDYRLELEDALEAGDRVVAIIRQSGRGKGSGAAVESRMGWLFEIRDGKIVGLRMFEEPEQALVAAGLAAEKLDR
jgi:ketosteroid isomerase-like protein